MLLLALLGLGAFQGTAVSGADDPTVEPSETASGYAWKPSALSAAPGGTVAFRNPGNVVPHGVHWTGGPEKPSCSGVPVDEFGTSWSGTCSFTQAGTYTFVCTVHPEEMKGTITVTTGETPAPPAPGQPSAAAEGPVAEGLQLARRQRGGTVHGSITVLAAAVGGRLAVEVKAPRATLSGRGKGLVRVGSLSRPLTAAGRLPFAVRLKPFARQALKSRGRLALKVETTVSPPSGAVATLTGRVKLIE